jgi:hypothetical protein
MRSGGPVTVATLGRRADRSAPRSLVLSTCYSRARVADRGGCTGAPLVRLGAGQRRASAQRRDRRYRAARAGAGRTNRGVPGGRRQPSNIVIVDYAARRANRRPQPSRRAARRTQSPALRRERSALCDRRNEKRPGRGRRSAPAVIQASDTLFSRRSRLHRDPVKQRAGSQHADTSAGAPDSARSAR